MKCHYCGLENPNGVQFCSVCKRSMTESQEGQQPAVQQITSGLAIASLVLGLVGIIFTLTALIGLILGIVALVKIKRNPVRLRGAGLAIAGICVSVIVPAIQLSILVPALSRAREMAKEVQCASNLSSIAKAIALYQCDFKGKCPSNLQVLMASEDIQPDTLICPGLNKNNEKPLIGTREELINKVGNAQIWPLDKNGKMHVFFERGISYIYRGSGLTENDPSGMIIAYDKAGNHKNVRNVLFADSHVEKMPEDRFQKMIRDDNQLRRQLSLSEIPAE